MEQQSYDYKKLIVYQKSMDLVVIIYKLLEKLPSEEKFGLRSQMSRAVVSIPSNISEGSRKRTSAEKKQFFRIALGSTSELETQLEICERLEFFSREMTQPANSLVLEITKMLTKMSY